MVKFFEDKESEICFGSFEEMDCIELDKAILYKKHLNSKGVSAVDFILHHGTPEKKKLSFIEAKRSVPRADVADEIDSLLKKFTDSLSLLLAYAFKRHEYMERFPTLISELNSSHLINFEFIVICNNTKESKTAHNEQIEILTREIRKQFKTLPLSEIWNIPRHSIKVLSVEMAVEQGLAVFPQGTSQ
jgi:hypothetical protein